MTDVVAAVFHAVGVIAAVALLASPAFAQGSAWTWPCEQYSASGAVFVGIAGPPVKRRVQLPDHPPLEMILTPVTVERSYLGVSTPVVFLTPLGVKHDPTPGRRYLIYGRHYRPPDIVMASVGHGAKDMQSAAADLAFLEALTPGVGSGTLVGIVTYAKATVAGAEQGRAPLPRLSLRVSNEREAFETESGPDGQFAISVPEGRYQIVPELPDHLIVGEPTSRIEAVVREGGCAIVTLDARPNGRVRGLLRGPDGRPLPSTSIDLVPVDVEPEPRSGHIRGTSSVTTNDRGEFEFTGRPAGRYYLGVSLYNAPNPYGPSYPRTYYPGTSDRNAAVPVVVEEGRISDGFDVLIPAVLQKGELEILVENGRPGRLRLCLIPLDSIVRVWSSWSAEPGVTYRRAVVDGHRYEVHAHLEWPEGHLESLPLVFTATTQKTVVRLRPDAPRDLH